jgi:uncharacterized protein CbrC (UPF0167 family)
VSLYMVRADDGLVKIGYTSHEGTDAARYAASFGEALATADGHYADEAALHLLLSRHHRPQPAWRKGHTEWFKDCGVVRRAFMALPGAREVPRRSREQQRARRLGPVNTFDPATSWEWVPGWGVFLPSRRAS